MSTQNSNIAEGFKMTELGPLPQEWEVTRLGDVIQLIRNGLTRSQNKNSKGIPVTRIETIADERIDASRVGYLEGLSKAEIEQYKLKDNDILFSHINSEPHLGKTAIYEGSPPILIHGMNLLLIRTNQAECDAHFLNALFKIYRTNGVFIGLAARAVGQASINQGKLKALEVILPPPPEQRAIARVLSTIQKAIAVQDKIIAAAREMKKSLMRHLFAYGPVPVAEAEKVPLKEMEIRPLPEHWEVVRLKEVTTKTKQMDPRRNPVWKFKYIDVSGISREQLKIIDFDEYLGADAPLRARKLVKSDDIVFATVRPCLKRVAIIPDELDGNVVSTAFCVIRCNQFLADPKYIFQSVAKDDFVQRVSEHQRGSSYPAVTDKDILNQIIPLPPLPEQKEIARMLSGVDNKMQSEENRKAVLQTLFNTMLHLLMTGKVRVKDLEVSTS